MIKKVFFLSLNLTISSIFADGDNLFFDKDNVSNNAKFISRNSYIQNPYMGLPGLTGNQVVTESGLFSQTPVEQWFSNGTWNLLGGASYVNLNGSNNYGYSANLFAQTGSVGGFSFGGFLTVANPILSEQINPTDTRQQAQILPVTRQINPQELFVEYKYDNTMQADVGWIGINNSPWLTYYQNNVLNLVTYQGAVVNIYTGSGWLLTALAFNGAQLVSETGFSGLTMYNSSFDYGTGTANIADQPSPGAVAFGASWSAPKDRITLRLWGYKFFEYAQMFYADSTINLQAADNLKFTVSAQGAYEYGDADNILNRNGYGNSIQSNMLGLQLGMNYSWFGLLLGYNDIWGSSNAYGGGGLVSPYTYQYSTDPLYTTSWINGMVEKSAGKAYKITTPLTFLDNNLTIYPSFAYYDTSLIGLSKEYDLVISYSIPQLKGLTAYAGYGYIAQENIPNGSAYQGQVMMSYLY